MTAKLKTEQNTVTMERQVLSVAIRLVQWRSGHRYLSAAFEHGQWWLTCCTCGAQWSVVDAEGSDTFKGLAFEEVSGGDGYCA